MHATAQMNESLATEHVNGNGKLEGLVKFDSRRRVKNNRDASRKRLLIGGRYSQIGLRNVTGYWHDLGQLESAVTA